MMTGEQYVELAMRTNDGRANERLSNRYNQLIGATDYDLGGIINGVMGLTGEAGEFTDMIKKFIFHDKVLDEEHAKKELGDVMWYIAMIAYSFNWNLDEIMQMNIDKLKARYPEGFDTERSEHRAAGDI